MTNTQKAKKSLTSRIIDVLREPGELRARTYGVRRMEAERARR